MGAIVKNSGIFVAWAEPDPKTVFSRFRVLFRYPAHSLQKAVLPRTNGIPMESRYTEGVPFANLENVTRHLEE